MTHSTPEIERLLDQLRGELAELNNGDAAHQQRLQSLTDRIEQQIANDLSVDNQGALVDELTDELVEFEVQHPTVAGIVRNMIRLLGNIGV